MQPNCSSSDSSTLLLEVGRRVVLTLYTDLIDDWSDFTCTLAGGAAHSSYCGWVGIWECAYFCPITPVLWLISYMLLVCVVEVLPGKVTCVKALHNTKKSADIIPVSARSFCEAERCVCSTCWGSLWECCMMAVAGMHNWHVGPSTTCDEVICSACCHTVHRHSATCPGEVGHSTSLHVYCAWHSL